MNKKLKIISCVVLCVVMCLFTIVATAHSGRTDANGGHIDNSTGLYHYHHGYSAHQHYDMDGDGIIDCPYDYDDKTNSNNKTISDAVPKKDNNTTIDTNSINKSDDIAFGEIMLLILKIVGVSLIILLFGCCIWLMIHMLVLTPLISWICKKTFRNGVNEPTVRKISIGIIVLIIVVIASIIVLKA